MTTPIEQFNQKPCCKLDALLVNAYVDITLDPDNPTGIILDTSWGTIKLDLKTIVKAGETITHLRLVEDGLCYEREDGETEFISGDDLSRIISMQLLKDVDQTKPIDGGYVYMYNSTTNLFEPFDLQTFVNDTNTAIGRINTRITNVENRVGDLEDRMTNVENRLAAIENAIYNWANDKNTKIARGNINVYGDVNNNNSHDSGIYTHDKNTNITNDLYFS